MTAAATTGAARVRPLAGIGKVAARRMVQAWEAPVFHLAVDVDMSRVLSPDIKAAGGTVTDAISLACARALGAHPGINAHFVDNAVHEFDEVNVGIAVATPNGLTVPVLKGIGHAELAEIAGIRSDVVGRARIGKLTMADLTGGTFTISNLGMMGIDSFDAILNPPQVAILAIGSTRHAPVVRDGEITVARLATFTATFDHRAVDGATGAAFLTAVRIGVEKGDGPE